MDFESFFERKQKINKENKMSDKMIKGWYDNEN